VLGLCNADFPYLSVDHHDCLEVEPIVLGNTSEIRLLTPMIRSSGDQFFADRLEGNHLDF